MVVILSSPLLSSILISLHLLLDSHRSLLFFDSSSFHRLRTTEADRWIQREAQKEAQKQKLLEIQQKLAAARALPPPTAARPVLEAKTA